MAVDVVLNSDQVLANRYRLILLVGQGTMGAVYDAEDLVFNRRVALKRLRYPPEATAHIIEQTRTQFEREARILATLRHPNLPRVTDYFTFSDQEFLVMDYIEGQSLEDMMIGHTGGLDEIAVLGWTDQLLSALDYIHQHGLVHRDIKPANVRVTPDGHVFLVDFGLVKAFDPASPKTATAVHGLGTPQYAPPEQYDAELGHTEPRSDLYSLGATMYHLLTGEPPPTVTRRVSNPGSFHPLREIKPSISPEVERVVLRAMEVPIARRFASANDMRSALQLARAHISGSGLTDTSRLPAAELLKARRIDRRRRLAALAGLLVLLAVCAGGFMVAMPGLMLSPSVTPTSSVTLAAPAVLPTDTRTSTPSATPTAIPPSNTPTFTPSATATATASATPSVTPSATLRRLTPSATSITGATFTVTPEKPGPRPPANTPTQKPIQPTDTHTPPTPVDTSTPERPTLTAENQSDAF